MRVLLLGGGGREHAIALALSRSGHHPDLFVAPGNGGTAELAEHLSFDIEDPAAVEAEAKAIAPDLVVIGPEAPLVAGAADRLRATGMRVFGPDAAGARIEGSKSFAKEVMERLGIPTARARTFETATEAHTYLAEVGAPIVVKADGLAAGKGVTVAETAEEAATAIEECFGGRFGEAGSRVVLEEKLVGQECSLLSFTDGSTVRHMVPAQDHKPVFEGDTGPNTGGMGVYSPVPAADGAAVDMMRETIERVVSGLADMGVPYSGVLYGGFILTDEGPKVLEFNARFGDPETQVVLPLLETDLLDVLLATAEGRLHEVDLAWSGDAALSVVMASGGYPGSYEKGKAIIGVEEAAVPEGVTVYHAGTRREDDRLLTAGGRVLNVTAVAPTLAEARERAYEAVGRIDFEGAHYRRDIGAKALDESGDESGVAARGSASGTGR